MTSKRARVMRVSSAGNLGLLNQLVPVQSPVALWQKARGTSLVVDHAIPAAEKNSAVRGGAALGLPRRPSIFSIVSPPLAENGDSNKVDYRYRAFFRCCFRCKEEIAKDKDVFMYGYLQAFCSPECREMQIAADETVRKPSPIPALAVTRVKEEQPLREFGFQLR